jgi:hypothetical protein
LHLSFIPLFLFSHSFTPFLSLSSFSLFMHSQIPLCSCCIRYSRVLRNKIYGVLERLVVFCRIWIIRQYIFLNNSWLHDVWLATEMTASQQTIAWSQMLHTKQTQGSGQRTPACMIHNHNTHRIPYSCPFNRISQRALTVDCMRIHESDQGMHDFGENEEALKSVSWSRRHWGSMLQPPQVAASLIPA